MKFKKALLKDLKEQLVYLNERLEIIEDSRTALRKELVAWHEGRIFQVDNLIYNIEHGKYK